MDFKRAIETFDVYMSGSNFSDSTRSLYQWALDFLCNYLQNPQLTAIIPDDLNRFWGWIRHDYEPTRRSGKPGPLAGRSLENIWTAERSFFGWCVETGKLKKRPDLQIKRPEYAPREVLPFTTEEVTRMLAATERAKIAETDRRTPFTMPRATAKRNIAMIMVFVDTGIRGSELARLTRVSTSIKAKLPFNLTEQATRQSKESYLSGSQHEWRFGIIFFIARKRKAMYWIKMTPCLLPFKNIR